jgi:hypothetical protein
VTDKLNFEPLTDDERASVEADALEADAREGKTPRQPPADAEPAEAAAARLFRRPPDMFWTYRDAEGAVLFHVGRWKEGEGRKQILPLSWIEGDGWTFAHWPAPRPLYNLDKIGAQPDAPIVVCEGEKAADAVTQIFPRSIATTSSAGANAFAMTDWRPLAARRVLIWPDNDQPASNMPAKSPQSSPT